MIKEKEIILDEKTYKIRQLVGTDATVLFLTLTKLTGGALSGLNSKALLDSNLGRMAQGIFESLEPEKFVELLKKIFKKSIIEPRGFDFDIDLSGNIDIAMELFIEILKLNYEKAIGKMKKKLGQLLPKTKEKSEELSKTQEKIG